MPQAVARAAADPPEHCTRCGVVVEATRHTRTDVTVGYYRLCGGPTETATVALDDDATLVYRRLVRPVVTVACPSCWPLAEMQTLWETWGEHSAPREKSGRGTGQRPRPS
jgi:hypothetical protein